MQPNAANERSTNTTTERNNRKKLARAADARTADATPLKKTPDGDAVKQLFVAMIIDKSGSMSNLVADTVGGFNEYLADLQRETPTALMSVTLFDTERDEMHVARRAVEIKPLTDERYRRNGMGYTALNDAIGGTIAAIDAGDYAKGRRVLIVVMTDGLENASREWKTRAEIAALVKLKEKTGWKFVFFGANIDAFAEGETLNIPATRSVQYEASPTGTRESYRKISRSSSLYAKGAAESEWVAELGKVGPDAT